MIEMQELSIDDILPRDRVEHEKQYHFLDVVMITGAGGSIRHFRDSKADT